MKLILSSSFNNMRINASGEKCATVIDDSNQLLSNIKSNVKKYEGVLIVANDPFDYKTTDFYANLIFESLHLSGMNFKKQQILDNRNIDEAATLIKSADLIFLSGGKVSVQNSFFKKIGIDKLLSTSNSLIIAGSAGAMNLGRTVLDFPEFITGIGLIDEIIIPHCDCVNHIYKRKDKNEFIWLLETSMERNLTAISENAYIFVDGEKSIAYGDVFRISKKSVVRY